MTLIKKQEKVSTGHFKKTEESTTYIIPFKYINILIGYCNFSNKIGKEGKLYGVVRQLGWWIRE